MSPIIDDAGGRAIANWFKEKKDIPHTITIMNATLPLNINVYNDREKATLELIFMRNGIKYIIDDISKISQN